MKICTWEADINVKWKLSFSLSKMCENSNLCSADMQLWKLNYGGVRKRLNCLLKAQVSELYAAKRSQKWLYNRTQWIGSLNVKRSSLTDKYVEIEHTPQFVIKYRQLSQCVSTHTDANRRLKENRCSVKSMEVLRWMSAIVKSNW